VKAACYFKKPNPEAGLQGPLIKRLCQLKECKKRLKRRFEVTAGWFFSVVLGGLGHENGDESQQENQHSACDWQHDGHQRHDGFHDILFRGGGVLVVRHDGFLYLKM
jgi:hypothetical protein